jgi:hypothetical protein
VIATTPAATAVAVAPEAAAEPPRALTSRFLDFWLLGGASVLAWVVMFAVEGFRANWAIDQHFQNLTVTTATLALFVNYPHFLMSYKLAYTRGRRFVTGHWWELIAVPAALIAVFVLAYRYFETPVGRVGWLASTSSTLGQWGVNAQVVAGPRVGDVLFTAVFNLMLLTIGWHYTKQVFGCMMVYAHFDRYPLTQVQRQLTKWALLTVWVMNFVYTNIGGNWSTFAGFSYSSLDLPDAAGPVSQLAVFAGAALVVYKVFYANYTALGRVPSLNLLVPLAALYVWWLPQTRQYEFYFLLVPLFHSLQYLPFVYKMEDARLRGRKHREVWATAIVSGAVLSGWLAFEFVPNAVDSYLATWNTWGMFFFFTAASLFINIHHYFIDSVVWRFKDPEVRAYLLN